MSLPWLGLFSVNGHHFEIAFGLTVRAEYEM
jgi:hypothetical protein